MNTTPNNATTLEVHLFVSVCMRKKYDSNAYSGCRAPMPVFDAMAPVTNGNTAAPAAPQLAIQPTPPEMRSGGRMRAAWFVIIGNIGPKKKPTKETHTASAMSDGTSQTTSSRLRAKLFHSAGSWDVRRDDADLPENRKYVYEDGASISDL